MTNPDPLEQWAIPDEDWQFWRPGDPPPFEEHALTAPDPMKCECLGWERLCIFDSDDQHHPRCEHYVKP